MTDSKRNVLVTIIRKAVGLPTGAGSCCGGSGAQAEAKDTQAAANCCGGSVAPVAKSTDRTDAGQSCCGGR
ncbi:MAG: hypothetical protein K0R39_3577 [Symbiobacteriaceae bacterium]|jgi:hypothetical protein|nr:hypothetical protein [Symbiobacteriaceae bacterium]